MRKIHSITGLVVSLLLAHLAGLVGSLATRPQIETWYRALEKPAFTPPDWAFPVVWPLLYTLMGVAAWMVWRKPAPGTGEFWKGGVSYESMLLKKGPSHRLALGVYFLQLILNSAWSFLFFYWEQPGWAFAEILLLFLMILLTARLFYRIDRKAGILMVPYIFWVGYASVLNGAIWWLNP